MLIALSLILAVAVAVLGVLLARARGRIDQLRSRAEETERELDVALAELREAVSLAEESGRQRDDAQERVQRARRDAAEVANRLTGAVARADRLEADNRDLVEKHLQLTSRIDGDVVWGLTLARIDRMWRVSVAAGVDARSPLLASNSLLADAVAIEVAAAREDAGALIDLTYQGDVDVDGMAAATAVALVEELVAGVIQAHAEAELEVAVSDDDVVVSVTATRDGQPVSIPGPADLVDDEGRYRIVTRGVNGTAPPAETRGEPQGT